MLALPPHPQPSPPAGRGSNLQSESNALEKIMLRSLLRPTLALLLAAWIAPLPRDVTAHEPASLTASDMGQAADRAVLDDLAPTGELRVSMNLAQPAGVVKDPESGELRGVTVDLGRELAARLGVPFTPVEYRGFPPIVRDLQGGPLDVGFLGIIEDTAAQVDLTTAYMELDDTYLVGPGSPFHSVTELDQPGVRIVTQGGATDDFLRENLREAELVVLLGGGQLEVILDMLSSGEADAYGVSRPQALELVDSLPGSRVLDDRFSVRLRGMALPKGRPAGLAYLTEFLEEMKASGFVQESIDRHGVLGAQVAPPGGQS